MFQNAANTLREYIKRNPQDIKGWKHLAWCYKRLKMFRGLLLENTNPKMYMKWEYIAWCYEKLNDLEGAASAWERVSKLRKDIKTLKRLGFIYEKLKPAR